jgi:hypothetical protein
MRGGGGGAHVALHGVVVDGEVDAGPDGPVGGAAEAAVLEHGADPPRHEEVARRQLPLQRRHGVPGAAAGAGAERGDGQGVAQVDEGHERVDERVLLVLRAARPGRRPR